MITCMQVRHAIMLLEQGLKDVDKSTASGQIAISLAVYKSRGEYDGTWTSAVACLKLAGYIIGA